MYIIELTNQEVENLTHLAIKNIYNPSENSNLFCSESKYLSNFIPKRIKEILENFVKNGSESGFLLIQNLPFPNIKTHNNNITNIGENLLIAKIQSLFMQYIGEMIGYEAEGNGNLFQNIIPIKTMSEKQTSVGSNIELEVHTEQAFSKLKPDLISLACIKGDENALTYILPVNKIIDNLTIEEQNLLFKPNWMTGVDLSFQINNQEFIEGNIRGPLSILNGNKDDPSLIFDQDLMYGLTIESNKLFNKILNIYFEKRLHHNLKSGEIIIIDNNRAIHGRSSFTPKYDGNDRFLIRTFGTFDLKKSEFARLKDNRVILAKFS